tara:strand:+ start:780 stop:1520 length:741 start_codon:yes stop_codon:yes gene_type:complete
MRNSAFICILVFLFSCADSPEERLQSLKGEWIQADTSFISQERLQIRFEKTLEYIQSYRINWGFPLNGCTELRTDTLRENIRTYRIATSPLRGPGSSDYISSTLDHVWACKVFEEPFDSLITKLSPSHGRYSEENNLLVGYSNQTVEEVAKWKNRHSNHLNKITSTILKNLPSDDEAWSPALFEMPTGKTISVHLPAPAPNIIADWDSLRNYPDQIVFDAQNDTYAVIFFDDEDEIEYVWWGAWES